MTSEKRKLIRKMKNNGFIFKARCINFISKLNIYQLRVLKTLTDNKIQDLDKKGLVYQDLKGKKVKKK